MHKLQCIVLPLSCIIIKTFGFVSSSTETSRSNNAFICEPSQISDIGWPGKLDRKWVKNN